MKKFLLLFIFIVSQCIEAKRENFFRKDYKFIESSNAFYKFHSEHLLWEDAKKFCEMEGAYLYYPENEAENNAVIQFWNETNSNDQIYIGVSCLTVKGIYETIHGLSFDQVYANWALGEPNDKDGNEECVIMNIENGKMSDYNCKIKRSAYICKKPKVEVEWSSNCDIPDLKYVPSAVKGKCYKLHEEPKNWTDAYTTCRAEQSYLAVINSYEEASVLSTIMTEALLNSNVNLDTADAVFLGFHNRFDDAVWRTILGKTLKESGFSRWTPGQSAVNNNNTCGSMFYNGALDAADCSQKLFFICEHDDQHNL